MILCYYDLHRYVELSSTLSPINDSSPVLPVNIVIERVITAQSYERPQSQSVGEEDLGGSIQPHLTKDKTSI